MKAILVDNCSFMILEYLSPSLLFFYQKSQSVFLLSFKAFYDSAFLLTYKDRISQF